MDSSLADAGRPAGAGEEEPAPPAHFSTGRLTRGQADLIGAWRARLLEDRPPPGQKPVSPAARMAGANDRPRASCSDVIAAAAAELLARPPGGLELARYADTARRAASDAGKNGRDGPDAPACPPVSFYLPGEFAADYEQLHAAAEREVYEAYRELEAEASRRPGADREQWLAEQIAAARLPRPRAIPRGTAARIAIDRWARRPADRATADAVAFAREWHEQPHRARRDMYRLRKP
jgi:hypothetical protein